jgi:2',3'-cyclic-nucleotide 2'-phosphodiesterase
MKLLFVGDVMGDPGRRVLAAKLPALRRETGADLVVCNAENVAHGCGVNASGVHDLLAAGVDVMTNGNHAWDKREAATFIGTEPRLLRPFNYPPGTPGTGWSVFTAFSGQRVGVLNLLGLVFMHPHLSCPFSAADAALAKKPPDVKIVLVDFHAEATSEKYALAWHLDGRVSAMLGTHTHVPTADERVLPGGTAYISDVGMTGTYDSVIGLDIKKALRRFIQKMPERFDAAEGRATLCGVLVDIDDDSGRSRSIRRIAVNED